MKTALILGATGQVSSYLAELLLSKKYRVVGASRRSSSPNTSRLTACLQNPDFALATCDVTDPYAVRRILFDVKPVHVYNLAAQSYVKTSFEEPLHTTGATYLGTLNVLEGCRALHESGHAVRVYQASSSEMFGSAWTKVDPRGCRMDVSHRPPTEHEIEMGAFQDEQTTFVPNSPYAIAKLAAHHAVRLYRRSYGLFASAGIIFNTESERRGEEFVTRKITRAVGRIRAALDAGRTPPTLSLGNLQAMRDWSHCEDTASAMLRILSADEPDDFVIATGQSHTVQTFVEKAFAAAGIDGWQRHVSVDDCNLRPCEVPFLRGRPAKAEHVLGWQPRIHLDELVERMVRHDIELAKRETI